MRSRIPIPNLAIHFAWFTEIKTSPWKIHAFLSSISNNNLSTNSILPRFRSLNFEAFHRDSCYVIDFSPFGSKAHYFLNDFQMSLRKYDFLNCHISMISPFRTKILGLLMISIIEFYVTTKVPRCTSEIQRFPLFFFSIDSNLSFQI
jgi:hypothetical protein